MHLFTNFLTLFLFYFSRVAAAAATPTSSSAAATSTARENCLNITQLTSDYSKFTTTLNNWNGSLSGAISVQNAASQVEDDWHVIGACRQTYVPGYAEYANWVNYCNGTFLPTVQNFVAAYKKQQGDFEKAGQSSSYKKTLQDYRNYTLSYRDKVVPPIQDSQTKSRANAVLNQVANTFYSSLGGGTVPPFNG